MKIEIGESLACSYLRHVERCWIAQVNWKAPEHGGRRLTDAELEALFVEMKRRFDPDGAVFKKTKDAAQFLKQGEIDVVGVDQQGGVHAMEVAFHEAGLNYGSTAETNNRVLKKMLRTLLILRAYHPPQTPLRISFLSPKVNPAVQRPLETTFADLRTAHPDVGWGLLTNDEFVESIVKPTLENSSDVADSSELFLRSVKLLETAGYTLAPPRGSSPRRTPNGGPTGDRIQPLVRALMGTLLVDFPNLLGETEKRDMEDNEYCKDRLGLQIGNIGLIRRLELGTVISGHPRYWAARYGEHYVCNNWWAAHHRANAQALLEFVEELARAKDGQPGATALIDHAEAIRNYLAASADGVDDDEDENEHGDGAGLIQPLVRALMGTLLVDFPNLLSDAEKRDMEDNEYCKDRLGLRIGNFSLIRRIEFGRESADRRDRYYAEQYGDFYVCSQWGKRYHCPNAQALRDYVEDLIRRNLAREDALRPHAQAFRDYLEGNCS